MSNHPAEAPPAGEHIHLPGPSYQPAIVTLGLTGMLLGILESVPLAVIAGLMMVLGIVSWVRSAVREYRELPLEHH